MTREFVFAFCFCWVELTFILGISMDYIRFYHLRSYDRINAPAGRFFSLYTPMQPFLYFDE